MDISFERSEDPDDPDEVEDQEIVNDVEETDAPEELLTEERALVGAFGDTGDISDIRETGENGQHGESSETASETANIVITEGETAAEPTSEVPKPSRSSTRLREKAKHNQNRLVPYKTRRGYKFSCRENCNCCSGGGSRWNEMEKRQLLAALRKYGSRRLDKVAKEIPTKTRELIQRKVTKDKRKLDYCIETQWRSLDGQITVLDSGEKYGKGKIRLDTLDLPDATPQGEIVEVEKKRTRHIPIEQWIDVVEDINKASQKPDCSVSVPSVLNWIADMESHPPPEDCNGVDYRAIYKYLALLCQGEVPPDLNPESSRRVSLLLPALDFILERLDLTKATQYLEYYRGPFSKYRYEESFNFADPEVKAVEDLSKVPGMNALGFHAEMMVKQKLPRLDNVTSSLHNVMVENVIPEEDEESDEVEEIEEDPLNHKEPETVNMT